MKKFLILFILPALIVVCGFTLTGPPWGFFAHKRINRMAVFTLPPEMMVLYKKHIEFITEHAVDPDKKRYATRHEAPRHFMDLDRYGEPPFDRLPRNWLEALMKYTSISFPGKNGRTVILSTPSTISVEKNQTYFFHPSLRSWSGKDTLAVPTNQYRNFVSNYILSQYFEPEWSVAKEKLEDLFQGSGYFLEFQDAMAVDSISLHGILPYNLLRVYNNLVEAFKENDLKRILQSSADIGHYIGDAHVPLHTTENYNGQLTDQVGIHGFWESRIPELFADADYDYFVGKASLVQKPSEYFWKIVLESYDLVDSVLLIEKDLRTVIPPDQQMCYETRQEMAILTQCRSYAQAYSDRMDGMVEDRMRDAILSVGSIWYTAWVAAGQPDLTHLGDLAFTKEELKKQQEEEAEYLKGSGFGRGHE